MIRSGSKVLDFHQAKETIRGLKASGKKIVQCHGTFDLVHPGHIVHFEEAKAHGDVLVVTLTAGRFVNKGPGRPYFNDDMRLKSLAALEFVDHVVLVPFPAAKEAILEVEPDIYCKGTEYANPENDVSGKILEDVSAVESVGGKVEYIGSVVFSSTKLLNRHFKVLPEPVRAFCDHLKERYTADDFRGIVEDFNDINVLLVGDIIFDEYSSVKVQGLTSKNRILSARLLGHERQAGGTLAVLRHLQQFTSNIKMVSLIGQEPWVEQEIASHIPSAQDFLVKDDSFTTIVKQRFVEPIKDGKEVSKLFCVNVIEEGLASSELEQRLCDKINAHIDDADLVILMDFGHGVCTEKVRNLIQEKAKFLSLNCQTNSYNHGFNIINHQYRRADSFSLDESEMLLACRKREGVDFAQELAKLRTEFGASYGWLTRGAVNTIGIGPNGEQAECLPLENRVVDAIGAGDAFCSVASLAAVRGLPIDVSTFMGQLAGAQAVQIVGNAQPISKAKLIRSGMSLLNV